MKTHRDDPTAACISFGDSAQARFKRFAQVMVVVPKSEMTPPEEALAKLEDQRNGSTPRSQTWTGELAKGKAKPS